MNSFIMTEEHVEILDHTINRAAGRQYCGDSQEMQDLCRSGLMRELGRKSFVPDPYFTITPLGERMRKLDFVLRVGANVPFTPTKTEGAEDHES